MDYRLRPARADDLAALDTLYTLNMQPHVLRLGVWDPFVFRNAYQPEQFQVIEVGGALAGMLKIVEDAATIYIAEIQVGSAFQGDGIGSDLLRRIQAQGQIRGKSVWLKVLRRNPAQRLYTRAGFRVFEETTFHLKMSWHPVGSPSTEGSPPAAPATEQATR